MQNYTEFYKRFGGSCRTKHLELRDGQVSENTPSRSSGRGLGNKRPWVLPDVSELPKEYIRMEPWEMEYLYLLAIKAKKGIVEIGRLKGGSTFLINYANQDVPIWSVDLAPQNDEFLLSKFDEYQIGKHTQLIVGDSQEGQHPDVGDYDLLFIDGDHSYIGCYKDLMNWFPRLAIGGHVIFHDCYLGNEVQEAVVDFMEHRDVEMIRSPYISATHWQTEYGSICHYRKLA